MIEAKSARPPSSRAKPLEIKRGGLRAGIYAGRNEFAKGGKDYSDPQNPVCHPNGADTVNDSVSPRCPASSRGGWSILAFLLCAFGMGLAWPGGTQAADPSDNNPDPPARPLPLLECLNLALDHNGTLREARHDLEATRGVVMQTKAILIPHVKLNGSYENFELSTIGTPATLLPIPDNLWYGSARVVQSIYEGGRMVSAYRSAQWLTRQALDEYQASVAGVLRDVRLAYYGVLLARAQQQALEESLQRLEKQVEDVKRKFKAGTSLRVEILQAEVELARLRPRLLAAKNQWQLGKTRLAVLLGFRLPGGSQEVALELADTLQMRPVGIALGPAVQQALARRPEIKVLESAIKLGREDIRKARSSGLPSVQVFSGYGGMNDLIDRDLRGWFAGVQLDWELFDGFETRGKVLQAAAIEQKRRVAMENLEREVEIQVRTAYANLDEARESFASLQQGLTLADESLRLTRLRLEAGAATQLELLGAHVAALETQSSALEALYRYNAALTQLEFATGANVAGR